EPRGPPGRSTDPAPRPRARAQRRGRPGRSPGSGPPELIVATFTASAAEMRLFRDLLSNTSGMDFGRLRETFLESRLRRRMREAGARSLYEYYRMVTAPGGGAEGELQTLVDEVSIHETSFFRNPPQFDTLETTVLADRVSARLRQGRRRLYLWSAGCSTGQEPY